MRRAPLLPVLNTVLCILIIFVCLSFFVTRGLGVYAARAMGESMLPTVPRDALLVLTQRHPQVGDIVHIMTDENNYAHRVVEMDERTIVTKGDNNEISEVAAVGDVSGVVLFHVPFRLFLVLALALIGIEGLLAALWSVRALGRVRRMLSWPSGA